MTVLKAVKNHETARVINLANRKIPANGDFLDLLDEATVDKAVMQNQLKLKKRGFHCYALGRYLWIVPSMHRELGVPDFERAKAVLPDLKSELLSSLTQEKAKRFEFKITLKGCLIAILGVVILNVAAQIIMPML